MAKRKRRTTTMTKAKRKRRVARGGSMRGKKSKAPWYAEFVGPFLTAGFGLILIVIPEPVTTATGLALVTGALGVAGIRAASNGK